MKWRSVLGMESLIPGPALLVVVVGGIQGETKYDVSPVGGKWLLTGGGGLSGPYQTPGLQFAGDIKNQKLFWFFFWMCYCLRQYARGASPS